MGAQALCENQDPGQRHLEVALRETYSNLLPADSSALATRALTTTCISTSDVTHTSGTILSISYGWVCSPVHSHECFRVGQWRQQDIILPMDSSGFSFSLDWLRREEARRRS